MNDPIPFPAGEKPAPKRIIKEGDLAKIQQVFPGKFVFVYVADKETKIADIAGSAATPEDIRLLRVLIHRVTLGDNGRPKGGN